MGQRRERFEQRFGPLGTGARRLVVAGQAFTARELMERLGLAADGCRGIDLVEAGPDRFAVRYLDAVEQRIVACEFDGSFRYLGETRVHAAEWIGDEAPWTWS
jgi:hypothetical protein